MLGTEEGLGAPRLGGAPLKSVTWVPFHPYSLSWDSHPNPVTEVQGETVVSACLGRGRDPDPKN